MSRNRTLTAGAVVAAGALVASVLPLGGAHAEAEVSAKGGKHNTYFTMAADGSTGKTAVGAKIPNLDVVKKTIRTYYNASSDGIADKTTSPYITELKAIQSAQQAYLDSAYQQVTAAGKVPTIVVDVDDTTLWTYDMEDAAMHFNFDPALQDVWVKEQRFAATPGMVDFVNAAATKGFAIFGLTGRNSGQEPATLANLQKVGYKPFTADNLFTKWTDAEPQPAYVTCAVAKCTTVEYKANTRKHIEADLKAKDPSDPTKDKQYDIVLNVGDQWSDLQGGYADRALKLPNPTYYLPSPNLPGVVEAGLAPYTKFAMKPDGSSGATVGGERIPNIDSVKATIRNYYGAVDGVASKSSPFVKEMRKKTTALAAKIQKRCETVSQWKRKPAIVLDVEDTLLWGYNLWDKEMKFHYDKAKDQAWVDGRKFPAVPEMAKIARKAKRSGCKLIAITDRTDDQRKKTKKNLNSLFDYRFTDSLFFTRWTGVGTSQKPSYVKCATATCTTAEYKSQTRAWIESNKKLRIIWNIGDQYSDLTGGHSENRFKVPNPVYDVS